MTKEEIFKQVCSAREELQKETISENLLGINFLEMYPGYTMKLLVDETEKICGFGAYLK